MPGNTKSLNEALLDIQRELQDKVLKKDASNPFHKAKFVSLNELITVVKPILTKNGVVLIQSPTISEGQPALYTSLNKGTEVIGDTMLLMMKTMDPQGQGSGITYARRYSLMSFLGLVGEEDDDGNAATGIKQMPLPPKRTAVETKTDEPMSDLQRKMIFSTLKDKDLTDESIKTIVRKVTGVPEGIAITKKQASELIKLIKDKSADELIKLEGRVS